jgi:hypothetical protein
MHERTAQQGSMTTIKNIKYDIMIELLTYLYTDECQITL